MIIKNILTRDEILNIVLIHEDAFKGFFLTTLGKPFLKLYYSSVVQNKDGILMGYFNEKGKLCGFGAATTLSNGFNKRMVKENFLRFSYLGLKLLLSRPKYLLRLKNNFSKTNVETSDTAQYAELLSIAVSVDEQGKRIGEKLLLQLEIELKKKGCTELSLTTDYYNNDKTIAFYEKTGYDILYEFIAYPDRKMYRMIKIIE